MSGSSIVGKDFAGFFSDDDDEDFGDTGRDFGSVDDPDEDDASSGGPQAKTHATTSALQSPSTCSPVPSLASTPASRRSQGLRRERRSTSAADILMGASGDGARSKRANGLDKPANIIDLRRGDTNTPLSPKRRPAGTASGTPAGLRASSAPRATSATASAPPATPSASRQNFALSLGSGGGPPLMAPPDRPKGDVSVCARLRPGPRHEMCIFAETPNCVRFRRRDAAHRPEDTYWCDHAFGPEATQEQVFENAVAPTCTAVLEGYNGAVIAYGQTGSGKTHTIIGDAQHRGVIPRALSCIFAALQTRKQWSVEVSVLEIYNERTRDLLAAGQFANQVDIHEVPGMASLEGVPCFECPDATRKEVRTPEEALTLLFEGQRKRETAITDMNRDSSRSHLIYTLTITQTDDALQATLRGRLHLVDLAGCERLKRSMASDFSATGSPLKARDFDSQRREAGAINKSLTQLALVIHRLTQPVGSGLRHVPYRDSMLTRLLAETFGGSSKTCLIINCSPLNKDREETKQALEFGKRANLVKNVAEINIEIQQEPSEIVKALVAKELGDMKREHDELRKKVREAAQDAIMMQRRRADEVRKLEQENEALRAQLQTATSAAVSAERVSADEVATLRSINATLQQCVQELIDELTRTRGAKKELQRVILDLVQQNACDDSAMPTCLKDATLALTQAKQFAEELAARPTLPTSVLESAAAAADRAAGAAAVEGEGDAGAARLLEAGRARARQREERLAGLEADARALQDRWGYLVLDRDGGSCSREGSRSPMAQASMRPTSPRAGSRSPAPPTPEEQAKLLLSRRSVGDGDSLIAADMSSGVEESADVRRMLRVA